MTERIVERATGAVVEAIIRSDVTREELFATQQKWRAYKENSILLQFGVKPIPEHNAWDWPAKHDESDRVFHRFYSLSYDDQIEGLMMLAMAPIESRIPGRSMDTVLYVEYIESAPWNLAHYIRPNTQYSGVGSALLATAVKASVAQGCAGRIGLHSLHDAEGFYRQKGFVEVGFDFEAGFTYFELPRQIGSDED